MLLEQNKANLVALEKLELPHTYPVKEDPSTEGYPVDSEARTHSTYFNSYYSHVLDTLQNAFGKGSGGTLKGKVLEFAKENHLAVTIEVTNAIVAMLPLYYMLGKGLPMGVSPPPGKVSSMILEAAGNPKVYTRDQTVVIDNYEYGGLVKSEVAPGQNAAPTFEYLEPADRRFPVGS